jgi:PQQ-dependent catabolism-associated CXXCW motif protein
VRRRGAILAAALWLAAAAPPEPDSYRLDDYRAPVPATVSGGKVFHTAQLEEAIRTARPVLIDVLPAPRRPAGMAPDVPWMPQPRRDIPGSIWLPDVGRGALSPALEAWFEAELRAATGGDVNRLVVFYCLDQCWMSWNATKRAAALGYRNAAWYPEGTDGWAAAGQQLSEAIPRPGAP